MDNDSTDEAADLEDWFRIEVARHRLILTEADRAALLAALGKLDRLAARLRRPSEPGPLR
ncbi:MAG: hypothetical protein RLO50_05715 [Azospirillaceae bacterium]